MTFSCRHEDLRLFAYGFLDSAEAAVVESHLLDCPDCRRALAELKDESLLVAFELSLDGGETAAVPTPPPPRIRRVLPLAAAAAAVLLCLAALTSILTEREPAPAPERPVAGGPGERIPTPDPTALAAEERNAALLRRLTELEEEVRRLAAAASRSPIAPSPEKLALSVEKHDWAALASALTAVAPDIAGGRMPSDPDRLRAYLEALEALRDLALETGTPATVKEAARDPRTGPLLFAAALRQSWPEAPEQDIESAQLAAKTAMEEYTETVAAAETSAERAAAEETLTKALTEEVRKLTETSGPPTVEPVTEPPVKTEAEVIPRETGAVEAVEPKEATDAELTVRSVLESAGVAPVSQEVFRGTTEAVVGQILAHWQTELSLTDRTARSLQLIAEDWVTSYRDVLSRTDPDTVRAFEARLGRGTAPLGVTEAELTKLRDALLSLQAQAERAVLAAVPATTSESVARVYFLLE
jgi:hypothetical protein